MSSELQERIDGAIYRSIPMATDRESRNVAKAVMKIVSAELAAAERRGAVRALREAAEGLKSAAWSSHKALNEPWGWLYNRADRMEAGDG